LGILAAHVEPTELSDFLIGESRISDIFTTQIARFYTESPIRMLQILRSGDPLQILNTIIVPNAILVVDLVIWRWLKP